LQIIASLFNIKEAIKINNKNENGFEIKMENIYSNSPRDISSHSFEDISSNSNRREVQNSKKPPKKKKRRKKHTLLKITAALLCFIIIFGVGFYSYCYNLLSKINRAELDKSDLGISSSDYDGIKNIALLGLDTREDNKTGRSDANVIVTIDKKNKKIKLTSIARDSYVSIDGHKKDKLTHAYAYGRSQLAVKTLNQNFGLEITDYVTMNFFELARIIDYIGGVTVDVDEAEMKELNSYVFPTTDFGDMPCEDIKFAGVQLLSGTQAVCYARIRHTDGDIERGNRQKEVLTAMFQSVKSMNPLKLPKVAELILSECETSLSTDDIMGLGLWTVLTVPEFEQLSIPSENIKASGKTINGGWYYVYDIDAAKQEIKDFIFEENYYSAEEKLKRESEQN